MKRFLATLLPFYLTLPTVATTQQPEIRPTSEHPLTTLLPLLLIPILLGIAGAIVCILLVIYTKHKQKMAMVKTEITPEEKIRKRESLLIGGICIAAIGGVLLIGLLTKLLPIPHPQLEKGIRLTSLVFLPLGVGLLVSFYLLKREEKVMKALLDELDKLKKKGSTIRVNNNDKLKGNIDRITDDELLVLRTGTAPNTYNVYIPINKITSLEEII